MNDQEEMLISLKERILKSRKYRQLGLNPDTVSDLIRKELNHHTSGKTLRKNVRRKLHNIVASYLGELDYNALGAQLNQIGQVALGDEQLKRFCLGVLSQHASTAERLPNMPLFYEKLFDVTGKPGTILDLACGYHPFAFPWMNLPLDVKYYAYDIIQPRIDLINQFFRQISLEPLAFNQDILVKSPQIHANLAIFFKEAHRLEKRQPGANKILWSGLNVDLLAVSLPTQNLPGTHRLIDQHRDLVKKNLTENQKYSEFVIENELIFLIEQRGN